MSDNVTSVDVHLERVLSAVEPLSSIDLTLGDAHGCVLAEDVSATFALPPFDNAAVDGYAVRSEDIRTASMTSPTVLPVVGDVVAGSTTPYTVQAGLSVRIMTGAPMPPGADAVVPIDETDGGLAHVSIQRAVAAGRNIRVAGDDAVTGWLRDLGLASWCSRPAASSSSPVSRCSVVRCPTRTAPC